MGYTSPISFVFRTSEHYNNNNNNNNNNTNIYRAHIVSKLTAKSDILTVARWAVLKLSKLRKTVSSEASKAAGGCNRDKGTIKQEKAEALYLYYRLHSSCEYRQHSQAVLNWSPCYQLHNHAHNNTKTYWEIWGMELSGRIQTAVLTIWPSMNKRMGSKLRKSNRNVHYYIVWINIMRCFCLSYN